MKKATLILLVGFILSACSRPEVNHEERRTQCENLERENAFWKTMNNEDSCDVVDCPEKELGKVVFDLLSPMFDELSTNKLINHHRALERFSERREFYLTKQEKRRVERVVFDSESPGERLDILQTLLKADREALDFLERVLNDEERMTAFFRGEEIPLREIPRCCRSLL